MAETDSEVGVRRPTALLLSTERPWPGDAGVRQRLASTLAGLSRVADVDLCCVLPGTPPPPPDDLPVRRLMTPRRPSGYAWARLPHWLLGRDPRAVAMVPWAGPARELHAGLEQAYDLAWVLGAHTLLGLGRPPARRVVLDVDDVPYLLLEHKLAARAGTTAQRAADRVDAHRWRRLLPRVAARVDAVAVCSELDRSRLGLPAHVVPNGYEPPARLPTRVRRGPPVLVFVGGSDYGPNDDAAAHAAREVLPLVRRRLPEAELWVVGTLAPGSSTAGLADLPGVRLLGHVPDVSAVLADADVAVVPVRYGGGTRIKVLEAWAHGVPVVSSTVGAEGLDTADGQQLLIADGAAAMAEACARVLTDGALRDRLVVGGRDLQRAAYGSERTREAVSALALAQLQG